MMQSSLFLSLLALCAWGLWAFFPRYGSQLMESRSLTLYQAIGGLFAAVLLLATSPSKVGSHPRGVAAGLLSGACATVGIYFYTLAMERGNPILVVSISSLYPLIAIFLFFIFFRDPISVRQGAGILCSLLAMYLMSH